ncbi:hypothetical protein ACWDTG_24720 [Rhodococcus zopfii]
MSSIDDTFTAARTLADLAAVRDARAANQPDPSATLDPAAARAVRARAALFAVVPYGQRTTADADDLESLLADLVADLRHLTDQLGIDWHDIVRRAHGYHGDETGRDATATAAAPQVEVIVVRDPDGPCEVETFVDGEPVHFTEYVLDAGAGWQWEDWTEARDENLATASPTVRAALLRHYDEPPGGEYIEDRDDAPWIEPAPSLDPAAAER